MRDGTTQTPTLATLEAEAQALEAFDAPEHREALTRLRAQAQTRLARARLAPIVGVLAEGREVLVARIADAEKVQEAAERASVAVRCVPTADGYVLRAWGPGEVVA